jgi:hypothetical protein
VAGSGRGEADRFGNDLYCDRWNRGRVDQ